MGESELRDYVKTLRTVRTNHQQFQKQLKVDSEAKGGKRKAASSEPSATEKKKLADEYLSGL